MRMNFVSAFVVGEGSSLLERTNTHVSKPEPKPIKPRPVKDPDYAALRKKVTARFSKTLAYLAK